MKKENARSVATDAIAARKTRRRAARPAAVKQQTRVADAAKIAQAAAMAWTE